MTTLYMTLKKEWFDAIASGRKTTEYRQMTDYWQSRLESRRQYTEILFRNGYSPSCPHMVVEYAGLDIEERHGSVVYALRLGRVLDVWNYQVPQG